MLALTLSPRIVASPNKNVLDIRAIKWDHAPRGILAENSMVVNVWHPTKACCPKWRFGFFGSRMEDSKEQFWKALLPMFVTELGNSILLRA
mmetsp:Transcript_6174/g.8011  ORF Transcript_6174/g.8011 Transcript_6174/m.8011 type:complete len:91 (-) Transcript_6174:1007-1279(-)